MQSVFIKCHTAEPAEHVLKRQEIWSEELNVQHMSLRELSCLCQSLSASACSSRLCGATVLGFQPGPQGSCPVSLVLQVQHNVFVKSSTLKFAIWLSTCSSMSADASPGSQNWQHSTPASMSSPLFNVWRIMLQLCFGCFMPAGSAYDMKPANKAIRTHASCMGSDCCPYMRHMLLQGLI